MKLKTTGASFLRVRLLAVFERAARADDIARAGWPFRCYKRGRVAYRYNFDRSILALDLGVAVVMGLLISRSKKTPPK